MKQRAYRTIGTLAGFVLGLGAPAGGLFFKALSERTFPGQAWLTNEVSGHTYFYAYMGLTTPLVFMAFGGFLGSLADRLRSQNSVLRYMMDVIEKQSITDELTGICNRRHLFFQIQKEINRSRRYGHPLAALMVDLDNFKAVNDRYGHPAGDRLLRESSDLLLKSIRNIDTVGRYGGDEFVILLPESGADSAVVVAERILENFRQARRRDRPEVPGADVSIGIAAFPRADDLTTDALITAIDASLLRAKSLGKNRIYRAA